MASADSMTKGHNKAETLGSLVGYQLRRAFGVFAGDFAAAMAGTGMRQVLVGILAVVSDSPGIGQGAVGRVLDIKRANMVPLINELVDLGLILREVDPADRRAFSLTVTDAGKATLADCIVRIEAHERRLLADFTAAEKALLLDLLERIARREAAKGD